MSRIRNRDTTPEKAVRSMVHALGYRFRLQGKKLPGKPDLVLTRLRTVIFVHGCFWHLHAHCKDARLPKSRTEFWAQKLGGNAARDRANELKLAGLGWRVIVVWACELAQPEQLRARLRALLEAALPDGKESAPQSP